jgi:hypothetical protein
MEAYSGVEGEKHTGFGDSTMSRPQGSLVNLALSLSNHSQQNLSSPTTHQRNCLKVVELERGARLAEGECTRNALRKHMIRGYG